MDTLYQLLEWNPVQVGSTFQGGGSYERRPPGGVIDLFGSGSKRRVAKHKKSMRSRKKGLEEKGENTERRQEIGTSKNVSYILDAPEPVVCT